MFVLGGNRTHDLHRRTKQYFDCEIKTELPKSHPP